MCLCERPFDPGMDSLLSTLFSILFYRFQAYGPLFICVSLRVLYAQPPMLLFCALIFCFACSRVWFCFKAVYCFCCLFCLLRMTAFGSVTYHPSAALLSCTLLL